MAEKQSIKRFIIRDPHGHIEKEDNFSVVGEVHVSIDGGVGEPSAESEYVDGKLIITLHNLKGEGISDISYTPSEEDGGENLLTITTDGGHTYSFVILNGSKGERGEKGETGPKGPQGDSAVYNPDNPDAPDFEMANTTGQSTTKAMTQKAVTDAILEATKDNNLLVNYDDVYSKQGYYVGQKSNVPEYVADSGYNVSVLISFVAGDSLVIHCPSDITTSSTPKIGAYDVNKEFIGYVAMGNDRTFTSDNPELAYISMSVRNADADKFYLVVNGVEVFRGRKVVDENVHNLSEKVSDLSEDIDVLLFEYDDVYSQRGCYVGATGNVAKIVTDSDYNISALIPFKAGDTGYIYCPSDITLTSPIKIAAYDVNKVMMAPYFAMNNARKLTSSNQDLAYIAVSVRNADADEFYLVKNGVEVFRGIKADDERLQFSVPILREDVDELKLELHPESTYNRNKDKLPILFASSNENKRLQVLIATDSHEGWPALQNAVDFANECDYIQALFVMGDCTGTAAPSLETFEHYNEIINTCTKPVFCIAGNHDVGYGQLLRNTALEDKICEYIIEPTYQHLNSGEYTEGKAYYYHDFTAKKVRVIFMYEYDEPVSLKTNAYWEAVTYDSSHDKYTIGNDYAVDDIVNFGLYTEHSFRCIQAHTASTSNEMKLNENRGYRWIGQEQMEWLVSIMVSTPAGYNVVICTHVPASRGFNHVMYRESKFCTQFLNEGSTTFNGMAGDYFGILADAFNSGSDGTLRVKGDGTFEYMNTLSEEGESYAFDVTYNFSQKNSGTRFMCFLAGHTHVDCVFVNQFNQYCVTPTYTTATTRQSDVNDVPRSTDINNIAYDALTVVAFDTVHNCLVLTRVGTTATTDGYLRDVDRIDL